MSERDTDVYDDGASVQEIQAFTLTVVEGASPGVTWTAKSAGARCSIGSHSSNDFVIEDPTVSRFHCEIVCERAETVVVDLKSRNGTSVDGVGIREAFLKDGTLLRLGRVLLRVTFGTKPRQVPLSQRSSFGSLVGGSAVMRAVFGQLERAARSDATVLLDGETGSGKGAAAAAIHQESVRRGGPFVVVDCSCIPATLLESELFGHERGAFTGAANRRVGAFEAAHGGTLFLDELGELPIGVQPKLLRALEAREIRRVGSNQPVPIDIRLIAATNRDLRAEVNAGRFRSDVYFRLAVIKITLPPLRQRLEDIPQLLESILRSLGADEALRQKLTSPEFQAQLRQSAWSGNVRELRNYIERCTIFEEEAAPRADTSEDDMPAVAIGPDSPYSEARQKVLSAFDRQYLGSLLARHGGDVSAAAAAAGIHRVHLYRLLRKHGLRRS